jgi:hypothetical protein
MCSHGYRYRLSPTRPARLCSSCIGLPGRRTMPGLPIAVTAHCGWRTCDRRRMSLPRMSASHGRTVWRQVYFEKNQVRPGGAAKSTPGTARSRFPARPNRRCSGGFRRSCFSRPDEIGLEGISAFIGRLRARSRAVPHKRHQFPAPIADARRATMVRGTAAIFCYNPN